jgi:hypothetical protein
MATVTKNRTYGKIAGLLGNNSKTVNNIRNLTRSNIYLPCYFEVNLITHLGVKLDTLVMIQAKFGFNWSSSFRGEDF